MSAAAWILWVRNMNGEFEKVSYSGKVLRDTSAMTIVREALRMGVEQLTALFPVEASYFDFVIVTIVFKMVTVLTCYRPIVLELICSRNACNFPPRRFF